MGREERERASERLTTPSKSPTNMGPSSFRASSECPTSSKDSVASFPVEEIENQELDESLGAEGRKNRREGEGGRSQRTSFANDDLVSCSRETRYERQLLPEKIYA